MHRFLVLDNGQPAKAWQLGGAYLVGSDGNAIRAEIGFKEGMVCCETREAGTAAVVVQQDAGDCGQLTVQTCLLPQRDEPYLLNLELARHRLMVVYKKLEDWGMFDLGPDHVVTKRVARSRKLFVEALSLQAEDPGGADKLASECLVTGLDGSEELALAHAKLLLERRKATASLPKHPVGCGVTLDQTHERVRAGLLANFDFLLLPVCWMRLAPEEGEYRWELLDDWAQWLLRHRMPVAAGPLVRFEPGAVPDWLFMWENDYDVLRDLVYEHIEQTVRRYRHVVSSWNVVSGLHVNNHFTFSFDQIMDLTRMATLLVKDTAPTSKVLVEIRQPFGEYYGQNQRSIPPLMYADLLMQSAVNFDGFVVKLLMGQSLRGQYTRDLMQISDLLDQFTAFDKPVHLTIAAPSDMVASAVVSHRKPDAPADAHCGHWRKPWSQSIQSRWLLAVLEVALSKPFVESVAWQDLIDHPDIELPSGGLVDEGLQPKGAFRQLVAYRRNLLRAPSGRPQDAIKASGLGLADVLDQEM